MVSKTEPFQRLAMLVLLLYKYTYTQNLPSS